MFGIFGKKKHNLLASGILSGATDIHSHLVPGVDDGSPNLESTLEMLTYMEELGYKELWLTPHSMEDLHNTKENLQQAFQTVTENYKGPLKLNLSSEYMMDSGFLPKLQNGDILPLGKSGKHLLVETSYMYGPENLNHILEEVFNKGYQPIIAHPERYMYMQWEDYEVLKEKGYKFQLNLNSLSGYYGQRPFDISDDLLFNGMYDFVGSDLHHLEHYTNALKHIKLESKLIDALAHLIENNKTI